MESEEILESIRELLYDLEHAQNDDEVFKLFADYSEVHPDEDWRKIDPQSKPAIKVEDIFHRWANREIQKFKKFNKIYIYFDSLKEI